MTTENLGSVGDLAFAGQEHEGVPVALRGQLVGGVADRLREISAAVVAPRGLRRLGPCGQTGRSRDLRGSGIDIAVVFLGVVELVRVDGVRTVRAVANLDRVRPAGHFDDRSITEMTGEPLRVDRGRGDD